MRATYIRRLIAAKASILLCLLLVQYSHAATLTTETLSAWEESVQHSKAGLTREAGDLSQLFCHFQHSARTESVRYIQDPEVTSICGEMTAVPLGLIHHWTGLVFIPNVRASDVLHVLQDYDAYAELYKPAVIHSQLLNRHSDEFLYRLKFVQKGFGIKAGLLGEFRTNYFQSNAGTGYSITEATQLTELQNPESPDEKALSLSAAHGYVEKVLTIVKYKESTQGVSVEVETLTLSRAMPASLRWLVAPLIQRFSRQTMNETLVRLRDKIKAVQAVQSASNR